MKICKFCGTQVENAAGTCPSCGAHEFRKVCAGCGHAFDDGEFCPHCGVKFGTAPKRCPQCGAEYYSNACPNCGYMPGKQAAQTTVVYRTVPQPTPVYVPVSAPEPEPPRKRHIFWWIMGFIFCFPIPVTILICRSRMPWFVKLIILAVLWGMILVLALGSESGSAASAAALLLSQGTSCPL